MKHRLKHGLPMSLAFLGFVCNSFGAQVSLTNETAAPGSSTAISVLLASSPDALSGVQFDVQYDGSAIGLSAALGASANSLGKFLYFANVEPNKKRFLVVGFNRSVLQTGALLNLTVNMNSQAGAGVYPLTVSNLVGTDAAGAPVTVTGVSGSVTAGTAAPNLQIFSAGSFLGGPVAPGEIISIFGTGIGPSVSITPAGSATSTSLGGTSLSFDGTAAPLLYAGPNQINAIAPYNLSGKTATQVQVLSGTQVKIGMTVPVASAVPGLFSANASGVGQGAILNEDATPNGASNPAAAGSIVVLFATGAGQTDPPGVDGQVAGAVLPKPRLPVTVQIGGVSAEVYYQAAAPGLVAGVLQVNCRVPANIAPGSAVPVVLFAGTARSQDGITMSVR